MTTHANAALTCRSPTRAVARLVVDEGWPISEIAARFQVSWPTVKRWVDRYVSGESMQDGSSRPKNSPTKTSLAVTKRCISLRMRLREGPVQLAVRVGVAPSTVHRILRSARLNRLAYLDRATGELVRRYEHRYPGSLVHVDVKKFGNIPDGGGWRYVGRRQGEKNRSATPDKPKNKWRDPKLGYAFIHTVIDDHSRVVLRGPRRRRYRHHCGRCDAPCGRVVHRSWRHCRTSLIRQWRCLPLAPVARHLRGAVHHPEV